MSKTDDQEYGRCATDNAPRLLNLDEAVEFLRGAYARRTLQNMAWCGKIRHIGRGQRMRFLPEWLLQDLLSVHETDKLPKQCQTRSNDSAPPNNASGPVRQRKTPAETGKNRRKFFRE